MAQRYKMTKAIIARGLILKVKSNNALGTQCKVGLQVPKNAMGSSYRQRKKKELVINGVEIMFPTGPSRNASKM